MNQIKGLKPVILIILDGWGYAPPRLGNAPSQANLPNLQNIESHYPSILLHASGINVGLPWWEEGNSEVGHLTIGSGRVIYQYLPRITTAIQDDSFFLNKTFLDASQHVKKEKSRIHLMGLVSSGAVHSYIDHLYALLELFHREKIENVYLHIFTDGRDTIPNEAATFLKNLIKRLDLEKLGKIATLCGRSFAMDRDKNWERIQKIYQCLTEGKGKKINDPINYLKSCYEAGISDEYIEPAVIDENGIIRDNDAIISFNFREERMRELTSAFIEDDFKEFPRKKIKNLYFGTMTRYLKTPKIRVAFDSPKIENCLGEVISKASFSQLRMSETEKYAHITYFFNGLKEEPLFKEERIIIPSEGGPHYDRSPEMQALNITERALERVKEKEYQFVLINFANPDMIGHTGNLDAAIKAAEIIDNCLGKILKEFENKYIILITADHGNFEEMIDSRTRRITGEHSSNPVPFYLIDSKYKSLRPQKNKLGIKEQIDGFLFDIAPTVLEYLGLQKPKEMIGSSLLTFL